jgi:hypothetical protein
MTETVLVPGARDVRASLDRGADRREAPDERAGSEATRDSDACVVACPPHPQYGGTRTDRRLRAVSDALDPRIDCLRFDYGEWDEGEGEVTDCRSALEWARAEYERVGLFGYSFGAGVALVAAARESESGSGTPPDALSVLAPPDRLDDLDASGAVDDVDCPLQVVYGERDSTVEWGPVVAAAEGRGAAVVALPADHHFVGQDAKVGEAVAGFLASHVR